VFVLLLDLFKDVLAYILILVYFLAYEVQLARQLPVFLGELNLKLLIVPHLFSECLILLPHGIALFFKIVDFDGKGNFLLLAQSDDFVQSFEFAAYHLHLGVLLGHCRILLLYLLQKSAVLVFE